MSTLEERIIAAFADNRYPGDDRLTVYNLEGRSYDETFNLLRGRAWQDMPVQDFLSLDTPIPDLTPEAFHYYMPALLVSALNEDSDVAWSLVFYLNPLSFNQLADQYPGESQHFNSWLQKRIVLFADVQRIVIADVFREFVRRGINDESEVSEAITYWESDGA